MKRIEDYEYLEGHRIQNESDEIKRKEDIKDEIVYKLKIIDSYIGFKETEVVILRIVIIILLLILFVKVWW